MADSHSFFPLTSPLTRDQKDIYFEEMLHPELALFHVGAAIYLEGVLDVDLFIESVREVYRECPDGCASIIVTGVPLQCSPEFGELQVGYSDLREHKLP
jgi:hypothetical protein